MIYHLDIINLDPSVLGFFLNINLVGFRLNFLSVFVIIVVNLVGWDPFTRRISINNIVFFYWYYVYIGI